MKVLRNYFFQQPGNKKVVGVVGELQFDVIQHRLLNEYGASCEFIPRDIFKALWITASDKKKLDEFTRFKSQNVFLIRMITSYSLLPVNGC